MYFEIMLKKVNWIFDSSLHHNNKKPYLKQTRLSDAMKKHNIMLS